MNPTSFALPSALKSLQTALHGMWRAFLLTCGLIWILIFYSFLFLWENSGTPADLWKSLFVKTAREDFQAREPVEEHMEPAREVRVHVKGHRLDHRNGDLKVSEAVTSQLPIPGALSKGQSCKFKDHGLRRNDFKLHDSNMPIKEQSVLRERPCLLLSQPPSQHGKGVQPSSPNPHQSEEARGQPMKAPNRKGWTICIEESYVSEVRRKPGSTELKDNHVSGDKLKQHEGSLTSSGVNVSGENKEEPSIFGTLTKEKTPKDDSKKRSLPQTSGLPAMFTEKLAPETSSKPCNGQPAQENHHEDETTPALVYQDGNLNSGTLEAFVQHMVPTVDYYPDRTYLFAFLLNSRLFIKPHQLLHDVCQVCIRQQKLGSPDVDRESSKKFSLKLLQLLIEWTETFPYDFRDERMMRHLRDITQKCVAVDQSLRKNVGQLMQALIRKLATLEKYEDVLSRVNAAATERMHSLRTNPAAFQTNIIDVCPSAYVLAQQLTHIELERLANIGPEEFVQSFMKEEKNEAALRLLDLKRTKNLEAYVEWFNRLSYLVATEVCMHIKKKHRAKLIEYFIDVARECYNIGNFNSLMAIMSGLNLSPVTRLKKTWGKVNMDKFEILEHQMDPTGNFNTYRQSLRAAMQRALGAQDGACDKIVIPFFSLFVKDLYFLNEGCMNKLANGYINFQKFWQTAKQVTEFMTWKQVECPYPRDRQGLNYLLTAPVFSENSLYLASYESEGPETNYEREQYKTLKLQCNAANK